MSLTELFFPASVFSEGSENSFYMMRIAGEFSIEPGDSRSVSEALQEPEVQHLKVRSR